MGLIEKAVVFVTLPVVYIEVHIADGSSEKALV